MDGVKDFCGYLLGLVFCGFAFLMCFFAWAGLEDMLGWRLALGGVVLGLIARINVPVVVGLYFYATNILGWPQPEALAFALPGLLIIVPTVATEVFSLLVGTAARR